jgi:hypothetical protein
MSATIVSIYPFPLPKAKKPSLYPGEWDFPVAVDNKPGILVIDDKVKTPFFNPMAPKGQENTMVPVLADEVARSIVEDQLGSMIHVSEDAQPGLFWTPGEYTAEAIQVKFSDELTELHEKQLRWFRENVREADDLWGRFRQHRVIASRMIDAANFLGLKREWCDLDRHQDELVPCTFCTVLIPSIAIVCPNCKQVLKKEEYEAMVG